MISKSFLLLGVISLHSATTVLAAGGGLRKALQIVDQEQAALMCQLATLHTKYMSDDNQITHGEEITCTLNENGVPTPFSYPIVLPNDFYEQYESKIEVGKLLVSIHRASLVAGEYVLKDDSEITVLDDEFSPKSSGRKLLKTKDPRDAFGKRRLIAFRVNGVEGEKQVVNSTSEIHRALFNHEVSVKTQYEKCSNGKLTWVSKGVHEISLPKAIDSYKSALEARNAAYKEIQKSSTYKERFGNKDVRDVAHNIMFCLPPSNYTGEKIALCKDATNKCKTSGNDSSICKAARDKCNTWKPKGFIANAQPGNAISTYSDKWCADLSTVVHELGHNMGRGHAGRNKNKYGDASSNMGGSGNMAMATGPQKCFNGAENIEFGWYKHHILHYNPLVDGSRMLKLASFVDVRKAGPANLEPVIIKVGKYNIQYNEAKDYNTGTGMKDRVTIVMDKDNGVTWFQAELRPEDNQFTFVSDTGKTVYVNYCEAVAGTRNTPDAVYIGIGLEGSACTTIPPSRLPICENRPARIVRYGDNQRTRCRFVNADICNRDALNRGFESTGNKIYNICQHQCADQAQCEAI